MDGYLFDPHTHTAETSKCGHLPAAEVVDRYVRHGFSGLVVTDHLHPEYLSRIDTDHDWNKVIDHYLSGYRASKQRGDEVGFQVLLGAELRFPENDNDYLVYGIDEAWLRSNPYVCCMSAREFFQKFHNQVLIIHAHPYRDGNTTVFEDAIHGTEIINGNPRHDNYNGPGSRSGPPPSRILPPGGIRHPSEWGRGPGWRDPAREAHRLLCLQDLDWAAPFPPLEPGVPVLCGHG